MAIPLTAALLILPAIFGLLAPTSLAVNYLLSGEALRHGHSLKEGGYELTMKTDCNLVLYDNNNNKQLWATNTSDAGSNCWLELQTKGDFGEKEGNLVIKGFIPEVIYPVIIWESNTTTSGVSILVVQHNGKAVIYGEQIYVIPPDPQGSLTAGHVLNENGEVINRKIAMVANN